MQVRTSNSEQTSFQSKCRFRAYMYLQHVKLCLKMSSDGIKSVTSRVNFHSDACSEYTSVQSIRRFRAYTGSEARRFKAYTGSETRRFKAYAGSGTHLFRAYAGSETRKFKTYASSETQRFRYLVVQSIEPTKILRFKLNKT